ncbi:hypothetical protein LV457_16350 [Mycobacterium sp. MYCO198283]|uniref:phage shock envelope stress response protein PspM n=1 Tax=Mycobacterium sp. MYCO198283 TaxID=2883505 RepID=UPI001E46680F|nr:hypothetical protein [Mycobacterium sp. MYCO198283]MCG5433847.1 hypothetical protein [Mycobacterium sp. MYCO198283]
MAVRASQQWRSLLQRGLDTASEVTDVVSRRLAALADPRARLLRKRRWARRLGLFFGAATVGWLLVTALLASWNTPPWTLAITGSIAAAAAFPATLFLLRYRWLRREPLPSPRPGAGRAMPPPYSAARPAMVALSSAERGLFSMLGVLERSRLLPADELRDLTDVARQSAATITATATEVVAMERAASLHPRSQLHLAPTIDAFVAQLDRGMAQYNEMVGAVAQLVSSVNAGAGSPIARQRYRHELADATDRMLGWAQAYDELRTLRRA